MDRDDIYSGRRPGPLITPVAAVSGRRAMTTSPHHAAKTSVIGRLENGKTLCHPHPPWKTALCVPPDCLKAYQSELVPTRRPFVRVVSPALTLACATLEAPWWP